MSTDAKSEQSWVEAYTPAGLFDPIPADQASRTLPGFRLLQLCLLAFLGAEIYAWAVHKPLFVFGENWFSILSHGIAAPMAILAIHRMSPRVRSGSYIFFTLEIIKASKHLAKGDAPLWEGAALLAFCLGWIIWFQLPGVVAAVPKVDSKVMKNRLLQKFQRTLNG